MLIKFLKSVKGKNFMDEISVLRRRMKKAGVTLKSVAYLAEES